MSEGPVRELGGAGRSDRSAQRPAPATMRDVAEVAAVSVTTVSHVINGSRVVQPATEAAVRAAIESTGYSGDGIARSLRRGTSQTIGLAMSALSNPYFADVVYWIEQSVTNAGYSLLLAETHDEAKREQAAVTNLLSHRIDALLLAPSPDPTGALNLADRRGLPVVLIDRVPAQTLPGVDAVGAVNKEPVAQLIDHLVSHGHQRIAMVTSTPGLRTTTERVEGYKLGLQRNGLPFDSNLVQPLVTDSAREVVDTLLVSPNPPTALALGNNRVTIATMRALRDRSMIVPDDIAVACFDDFPWADLFHPRLTTISQPVETLGKTAVQMLLERVEEPSLAPRHVHLDSTFVVRESCGCHAGE